MLLPNDKRHYVDKIDMEVLRKAFRTSSMDVAWHWALNTICLQNELLRMIATSPNDDLHSVEQGIRGAKTFLHGYDNPTQGATP